jgi:opacity protein-like surface antigen
MKRILAASAAALMAAGLATAAQAQEAWIGAYAHDVKGIGLAKGGLETGADIQLGYKTAPIQALHVIFSPSFYVLGSANTSSGTNFAGVGLGWRINLGRRWYFDPGLGFVGQDGYIRTPPANAPGLSLEEEQRRAYLYYHRIQFGSRVVFEPEFALGYRITDRWAAELSYVHLSQAHIFGNPNQGMDDVGVRLIRRFGPR